MKKKKNKVLITGALGQDGVILSKILLKKKFKVFGIIKKKRYKNKIKGVKYLVTNLSRIIETKKLLLKIKPDYVVHLGSENPSYLEKNKKKLLFNNRNKKNSLNLINSIISNKLKATFIFGNSSQIFEKKYYQVNEKSKIVIKNSYTKFRIDILKVLKNLKKKINFRFINLILFNHDSIHRNKKFLFPRVIKAIKNENIKFINEIYKENIYGDFSHAEDICNGIYLLIKKNIVTDNIILSSKKLTSVNKIIYQLLNKKLRSKLIEKKNINKKNINLIGDNSFAKKVLGWKIKKNISIATKEISRNLS